MRLREERLTVALGQTNVRGAAGGSKLIEQTLSYKTHYSVGGRGGRQEGLH